MDPVLRPVLKDSLTEHHLATGQIAEELLARLEPSLVATEVGTPPSHAHTGLIPIVKRLVDPVMEEEKIGSREECPVS